MTVFSKTPAGQHRHPFTLVELMAAMAVFMIMMLLLMRFTNTANTAWSQSDANMKVFSDARAALDLIDQDLRGIVLSDEPGAEVELATAPDLLTFVSTVGEDDAYASKLVEVSYKLSGSTLQRKEVGDNDSTNWNFLGAPSGWETNAGKAFEDVITGVESCVMDVYKEDGTKMSSGQQSDKVAYIKVTLTLIDERAANQPKAKTMRTFSKTIFLNQ